VVTPDADWNGLSFVAVQARDPWGALVRDTLTVEVTPVNDPPVFSPDTLYCLEDQKDTLRFSLFRNWTSDPDSPPQQWSFQLDTLEHAKIARFQFGWIVTPDSNWFGETTLGVTLSDGDGAVVQGAIVFLIAGVNDPPELRPQEDGELCFPDTLVLNLWELSADVETPDSLLIFSYGDSRNELTFIQDAPSLLKIVPPRWNYCTTLHLTVRDSEGDSCTVEWKNQCLPEGLDPPIPTVFKVDKVYPNPFNASLTIPFQLPRAARVQIAIYDLLGRRVFLREDFFPAGKGTLIWDAGRQASGIYYVIVQLGEQEFSQKTLLIK
jgi:hypothetical protein